MTFYKTLRFWLQLGFISFGGLAGQIAIMHRELVEKRRWVSEKRFLHALNFCMVLPGPEAQQLAIYLGWLLHKTRGGVVAGISYDIKPAVAAIVLHTLHRIARKSLGNPVSMPVPWAIAAMSFIAIWVLKWPFPLVVLSAMLLGVVQA